MSHIFLRNSEETLEAAFGELIFIVLSQFVKLAPDVWDKDRVKWAYSMKIDSAERFTFSFKYNKTQFRTKHQSIFRMKRVDSWYGYAEAFKVAHAR